MIKEAPPIGQTICDFCQKEFTPKGAYKQKYCSPKHRHSAKAKSRAAHNVLLSERRCYRCKEIRPTEEFSSGGTHTYCKECYNAYQRERLTRMSTEEREEHNAKRRRYKKQEADRTDPAVLITRRRKYRFGLTEEQVIELLAQQDGGCAICHATEPGGRGAWPIDHDHACCPPYSKGGKQKTCGQCIRSLLCNQCNLGLGNFRHDPELLIAAAKYLARYQTTIEIVRT
jgi:hypothetical protein